MIIEHAADCDLRLYGNDPGGGIECTCGAENEALQRRAEPLPFEEEWQEKKPARPYEPYQPAHNLKGG